MPVLRGDKVVGWANVELVAGKLTTSLGYAGHCPAGSGFGRALDAKLARLERFLATRG